MEEQQPTAFDMVEGGLLLVDKPVTWTSFDAVGKLRGALRSIARKRVKVGHAGTLDPLASGLLLLGFGRHTKQLPQLTGLDKTYIGRIKLGVTTPSFDAETAEEDHRPWAHIGLEELRTAVKGFLGEQLQRPPLFSAKRIDGERAYHLARRGEDAEVPRSLVRIDTFTIDAMDGPEALFTVRCSKGTYIRSLAHDLGQALGCGAYLSALRRTHIGDYSVADARSPDEWSDHFRALAEKARERPDATGTPPPSEG